ncbi:hypothetical protein [Nocardia asteroides]|uniref:hypothetical protein n=1 Tax=Nocardia asteroides TaxID=1824 RepID=UPI001E51328B|nr:hypothetical protein [Nocardia asteroides]UGT63914.1 hypothetical protein LTT61_11670 [Nocardia asteroides]
MEHAAIVTPGRRMAAWSLDFGVVVLLTAVLGWLTQYRIGDYLSDWPSLGAGGAWELMGSEGDVTAAGVEIGSGVLGELMSLVTQGFLALIVLTGLVRFGTLAWTGHSAGGALAEVRTVAHGPDPLLSRGRAARYAISTTLKDVGLYAAACIALVHGAFALSVVLWALALAVLIADAVPALRPGGRSLCDRLSGTAPTRARRYRRALEQSAHLRRAGIEATQQAVAAGRRIASSETAEQAREAAAERAQQAKATSRRIAADVTRRVESSDHARQAAATGKRLATDLASSERARRAKAAGQRLGDRLRGTRP